ncbi:MAG: hypothetical protein D6723_07715 [Acidobacteria bacterium]|nr:MAG: hypothetical protein D6723_07715 [Acidobacteriota bacterium]
MLDTQAGKPTNRVTFALCVTVLAMAGFVIAFEGVTEAGLRILVRASARSSAIYFFTAFAGPGVALLRWSAVGTWIGHNSPSFFVAFGFSHLVHLLALVLWASLFPTSFFSDFRLAPVLVGAMLYLLIAFMCIRLILYPSSAPRWVRITESTGNSVLWLAFALAFVSRALSSPVYGLFTLVALGALGVRLTPKFYARSAT